MPSASLPALSQETGLTSYLQEIRQFPLLEVGEEFQLARRWRDEGDTEAAHRMVTSHLRLAAKMALGYRGYGLPMVDVISEANLGLMQAVKRFDPERGHRLATYAMWWIRASIQEYILRSWSLVKIGTTSAQKKLFFNLRRAKSAIAAFEEGDLRPEHVQQIAENLHVSEADVIHMNRRLAGSGDLSLNAPVSSDEESQEWQDWIVDDSSESDQVAAIAQRDEFEKRHQMLIEALKTLSEREQVIIRERRLSEDPRTLEQIAADHGISRERVRQIEIRAFERIQEFVRARALERGLSSSVPPPKQRSAPKRHALQPAE